MNTNVHPIVTLSTGLRIVVLGIDGSTSKGERLSREFAAAASPEELISAVWHALDYRLALWAGNHTWIAPLAVNVVAVECASFDG